MLFPYLLRRMRRRKKMCIIVGLASLMAGILVYGFHLGVVSMTDQIENVLDNSEVTCAVTNLTGTQADGLMLPDWASNLFRETTPESVHIPTTSFLDYVDNIKMKFSMEADCLNCNVNVFGVTSIFADRSISLQEQSIEWFNGFDDSVFESDANACIISDDLYSLFQQSGNSKLELTVKARDNNNLTSTIPLDVAGILHGKSASVYCPWETASKVCLDLNKNLNVDCISATIIDNRKIEEFKEKCANIYFAEVDPRGVPQPWEASPIYESYPFALEIYDKTMNETIATLKSGMLIFNVCQIVTVILILCMGFIVATLSIRHRQRELALQNVLGFSKWNIFYEIFIEYVAVSFTCLAIGVAALALISKVSPPWFYIAAVSAAGCLGTVAGALPLILNKDILLMTKTE